MGKSVKEVVAGIAEEESRPASLRHDPKGAVTRAAGRAGRAVVDTLNQQRSLRGVAEAVGLRVDFNIGRDPNRGRYLTNRVSDEERELYGYGDLPKQLINDVSIWAFRAVPDHLSPGIPERRLTGRVMGLLVDAPTMADDLLLARLAVMNESDPLFPDGETTTLDRVVALNGIIQITSAVTRAYLQDAAEQSRPPISEEVVPHV